MPNWSEPWDYNGVTFIRCKDCGKIGPLQFKNTHKCKATETEYKKASETKPKNEQPTIEEDVGMLLDIAKKLAYNLEKDVKELNDGERSWVSTIFIQRKQRN